MKILLSCHPPMHSGKILGKLLWKQNVRKILIEPWCYISLSNNNLWFSSARNCVYGAFVLLFLIYINDIYTLAVRQTTQIDVSLSCYVLICWSIHQMSEKCKIDIYIIRHIKSLFLNWLSSWEFGKDIFSQNWKEDWNKEIHCSKKIKIQCLKLKLYHF